MNAAPQISALLPWKDLSDTLANSFTARAHGLLGNTLAVQKDGLEVGQLVFDGRRGAEFSAGTLKSTIKRNPDGGYAVFSGKSRILATDSRTTSLDTLKITCGKDVYQVRISFLRNRARACSGEGKETVLLKGDVIGRRYKASMDRTDPAALPIAILLLYHTATLRRRAYVA